MGEGNASTAGEATPSTPRKSEEELEKAARKKEKVLVSGLNFYIAVL